MTQSPAPAWVLDPLGQRAPRVLPWHWTSEAGRLLLALVQTVQAHAAAYRSTVAAFNDSSCHTGTIIMMVPSGWYWHIRDSEDAGEESRPHRHSD